VTGSINDTLAYEIAELLVSSVGQMNTYFERVAGSLGLSEAQGRLLIQLEAPAPMGHLAEHLDCDASNITGLVDRMEGRGLVRRVANPEDRRSRLVEVTAEGRRLRDAIEQRIAADRPSIAALSPADQRELRRLLDHLHEVERERMLG
jgi:DNA-binding MarR family transcriptional regulator